MFYYKAIHKYQLDKNFEIKEIGEFDSQKKAAESIENVKNKPGFAEYRGYFFITKFFKLFKPALLNNIYWIDGFDTYYFNRKSNQICSDKEQEIMKYFSFLLIKIYV